MSPRWKKIWSDLTINKTRTALVVLSIVVGIFAVGSIAGTSAIIDRESKALWEGINPPNATLITSGFDLRLAGDVAARDDVETVQVRRGLNATAVLDDGSSKDMQIFTVPDYEAMQLAVIEPESGAWPPAGDDLLIERSAMGLLGLSEGDSLTLNVSGEQRVFTVSGVVYDLSQPAASVLDQGYGYVSPELMADLTGEGEGLRYSIMQFTVDDTALSSASLDEMMFSREVANAIRDDIQRQGVRVVTPPLISTPGEPDGYVFILALLVVLGVVGSLTFVLSGFLIVNIISALLAQQTRQIGVMKAIGARSGQVVRMYLGLALAFGVFALILALPLSFFGARALAGFIGDLNNYKISDFSAPWWVFALQIVIGLVVPVVAALVPVWTGTRTTVREALDSRGIEGSSDSLFNRLLARLSLFPRPVLLSFRNMFRQKGRLLLTLATLTLAGAIFATVFTVRNSLFATLDDALAYEDYSVAIDLDEAYARGDVVAAAATVDNVTAVEAWTEATERYVAADGEELDITLRGLPVDSTMIQPIMTDGEWLDAAAEVSNGIVINSNVADTGVAVGDTINLILRGEDTEWQVVGIAQAVFSFENVAWTPYETLTAAIGEPDTVRTLRLDVSPNTAEVQDAVISTIDTQFAEAGYTVVGSESFAALEVSFNTRFNVLVFSLLALALLLAIVGGLGIAGTTSINVIERMREIGVMRSVGAANYQILGIFIVEAVFVGAVGWLLGSLLALPISRALSDGVGLAFSNAPLTYSFDVAGALLWLALAAGLAFIFSFLPARRASQLTLREVLNYEG